MGRNKTVSAPKFSSSEIRYGDTVIGKTYQDPATGAVVTQYIPDETEVQRKKLLQDQINTLSSSIGTTASELATQFNSTENAFISDATQKFLDQYNPTVRSLREDVSSRFGTLNSSEFLDGLKGLESTKASALVDIINRGKLIKSDLVNQDESRKLNQLQALSAALGNDTSSFQNTASISLDTSNALNDFLSSQWVTQLKDLRSQQASKKKGLFG